MRHIIKISFFIAAILITLVVQRGVATATPNGDVMSTDRWNPLTPEERRIIEGGGTERAFTGEFVDHHEDGTYTCARCGSPLFSSDTKFESGSGWPSFDNTIPGAILELPDSDGRRTEIQCARCSGHLGHVFRGEMMTPLNTRHCVNSASLDFAATPLRTAYFAGGCFWGVEHLLQEMNGVISVESGYMAGDTDNPTYEQICTGTTGHAEAVEVTFDPTVVTYRALAKRFFEIHDPTQLNRQGPDVGGQYRSGIYTNSDEDRAVVDELIGLLTARGLSVVTEVEPAGLFWPAEEYHQDYYERTGRAPYCHAPVDRFGDHE